MENYIVPLISPLSRKYYDYACNDEAYLHHRGLDIRHCLEIICNELVCKLLEPENPEKWLKYPLFDKIKSTSEFLDKQVYSDIMQARLLGNVAVHEGEEGSYNADDIENALHAITQFSIELLYHALDKYGFSEKTPSTLTLVSVLPPVYRVQVLEKLYKNGTTTYTVIDKLSKAYLKNGEEQKAYDFLKQCLDEAEISYDDCLYLARGIAQLSPLLPQCSIAQSLEMSRQNFNRLHNGEDSDAMVCLLSIILNGVPSSSDM